MNPFSRPPSRPGTGTGTSESASFHSIDNQDEPELEPIDINETTVPYEIEPETETQLPDLEPEPTTAMANTTTALPAMEVDHKGKSYLKKPEPFNGNRRKVVLKYRKVTRPGIEPRTFWTYTRCSNQLSYPALEFNQLILYLCNC